MVFEHSPSRFIVVVDDDDGLRASLRLLLERWMGRPVRAFPCGRMALDALQERPSVAVLDVDMVSMPGLEVATALRHRWPSLPIVFLTGCSPDAQAALRAVGPEAILSKPVEATTLVETIERAFCAQPVAVAKAQ